jgi:hypothetical protein
MSLLVGAASNGSSGYSIDNSLIINSADDAYLSRANGSTATLATSGTISMWVKKPRNGSREYLMQTGSGTGNSNYFSLFITNSTADSLKVGQYSVNAYANTTNLYRDPSAWYHIVMAFDSTESTGTDRVKMYVNGELTTNTSSAGASSNFAMTNNGQTIYIGRESGYPSHTYMSEVHLIDGQTLAATDFGETNPDGQWIPKAYGGTYGNNGFYLKFDDNTSTTTLGEDSSGNGNDFTLTNMATTDQVLDSPTENYCTLNPLDFQRAGCTYSEGNLKAAWAADTGLNTGTINIPKTGKWYWEVVMPTGQSYQYLSFGIVGDKENVNTNAYLGSVTTGYGIYAVNGTKLVAGVASTYMAAVAQGTVMTIAYDADSGSLYIGAGGSWANGSGATNQAFGTATAVVTGLTEEQSVAFAFNTGNYVANFGQKPFTYTPPTGYLELKNSNLPNSTIKDGSTNFNTVLYTGTGAIRSVTGVGFQPDFVWGKARNTAYSSNLYDSVRGATKYIYSNATTTEVTEADSLTSFDSDGFSTGANAGAGINYSGVTYVAWNWKANGTGATNEDGSTTSTVSANTTAGFSVVTYTGTGSNATVGHGLGVAPKVLIGKNRTYGVNWRVYHESLGATKYLNLNLANAAATSSLPWNNTAPTSSVFSIGTSDNINRNTDSIVMYCFAEVEGYSKFGSYTGNGNANGTCIYTGFKPKMVIIKTTSASFDWVILDTERNPYNLVHDVLYPSLANAEADATTYASFDAVANGFKLRNAHQYTNYNGYNYIYMAFAENPFKNSTAR